MRSRPAGPQLPGEGGAGGAGAEAPGGAGGFAAALAQLGLRVDPGDYTVKVKLGETELSKPLKVVDDPRVVFSAEDRAKKRAALNKLQPLVFQSTVAQSTIVGLRTNLNTAIESWKRPGAPTIPDNVKKSADELLKKIDSIYVNWGTPPPLANTISQAGPPLVELPTPLNQRVAQLLFAIEGASNAPTDAEMAQIDILTKKIPPASDEVRKLVSEDLVALNTMMLEAKIPYIQIPAFTGGGGGRRPPTDDDDPDRTDP